MEVFVATIQPFAFNFAPRNWAFCAGQLLSIAQNSALFSLVGTTYGGNGQTTFGLPDLRGRMAISQGQGPGLPTYTIGELAGTPNVSLTIANLPQHNHLLAANGGSATSPKPANNFLAQGIDSGSNPIQIYAPSTDGTVLNPMAITPTGGNQPFSNMPPFLTINYCIALTGIFPSRN